MIHIKRILYPTDFSSYSNQAYFHAVALAENHGAELTIIYVHSSREKNAEYWRGQLEQIRPLNRSITVRHKMLFGDPATEIVRFAHESMADLIVMGTHGRTGVEKILLGSVAEKVMQDAPCSVMVVKLPRAIPDQCLIVHDDPRATNQ
ncbi:MAG: universal stress protein [Gemmatales bacterium]|nr:MAG: universal stress protein [Gemmatales bacterium]